MVSSQCGSCLRISHLGERFTLSYLTKLKTHLRTSGSIAGVETKTKTPFSY